MATTNKASEQLQAVEALAAARKTPAPVFSGVCSAQGWRQGKQVSPAQYDAAVASFLRSPIGGGK